MNLLKSLLGMMWPLTVSVTGRGKAPPEPSPASIRAQERLEAHRKATAARLWNCPPDAVTRQQERAADRRAAKMPVGMIQSQWHAQKGLPDVSPLIRKGQ